MSSRLYAVIVDAHDHRAQAAWWAEALGWTAGYADDEIAWADPGDDTEAGLGFVPVPEPKTVKNRLHLDLRGTDQSEAVARLERLGATRADVGQGPDVSWVVLADPEGNELCVLAGPLERDPHGVGLGLAVVCIDAVDVRRVADFWGEALGYSVVEVDDEGIGIAPPEGEPGLRVDVLQVPEPSPGKNRVHLDLNPDSQDEEVKRLMGLGATWADVGQGDEVSWVVLADPEGNELCVLTPRGQG